MPAEGAIPVIPISLSRPSRAPISLASAVARRSVQLMTGAMTAPAASVRTTGSRWQTTASPATRAGSTADAATAARIVWISPKYQSSGSFSAQPGWG